MRPFPMLLVLLPSLALWSAAAAAAEAPLLAVRALENLDAFDEERWSYTRTTRGREGTRVERHDAARPEGTRWTLLSVDGRPPTAREQESFRREREEMRKRDRKGDEESEVDRSSIRLVSENPQRATFSFRTSESEGLDAKMAERIAGTLVVNKDGGWAERFELRSTGPIAPVPGVKVSSFRLTMTFQRLAADVVPESVELSMRGRAFLVKSLDDDRSTRYSDFVRVR